MKKFTLKTGLIAALLIIAIVVLFCCVSVKSNVEEVSANTEVEQTVEQPTGLYLSEPAFKYVTVNSLTVRGGASTDAEEWDRLPYGAMVLASSEVNNNYCLIIYTKGTTDYSGYVWADYLTTEEITAQMIEEKRAASAASTSSVQGGGNMRLLGTYYITGYDTCARCCGKSDGITASGRRATVGRTVAMSGLAFGTRIYIEGIGYRVVEDRGVSGGKVDVLCSNHSECYAITGRYKVYIVE